MLPPVIYRFAEFELDLARVELRAQGAVRALEPQVFALLALLVENRDRLVSRDEILEKVWDGRDRVGCRPREPHQVGAAGAG